ncbi:GNAT family N-acetyltransferase [Crocinitomix algicola]|uniref:GNAT family N-acetyltransferase n=1 Tax=Crocinitomix algicola TaxID=1740263 RepID=UPI000835FECB|nr:GNAT family N-acetyltransferase [Crocinitomix algicola]
MKILQRKDIDVKKWNERIFTDHTQNIFSYSWYLDAVAPNWIALVDSENYHTIVPITISKKLGVKRMYQAPFTREFQIFGNDFNWADVIAFLKENKIARGFDFRVALANLPYKKEERTHQILELKHNIEESFSKNGKRLIKKAHKHFTIEENLDTTILLELFEKHLSHKINTISKNEVKLLNQLMQQALENDQGKLYIAKNQTNEIVASAFFLYDNQHITYLKGVSTEKAKKEGAMYGILNKIITENIEKYTHLDFGGSDIESIATFFKKFGAIDRKYYHYKIDYTPFWFKQLKKLKS